MSKQILHCGTAIGTMVSEAQFARTKPDLITKLHIANKEANELNYWLTLMVKTEYLSIDEFTSLKTDRDELLKLLTASLKTVKGSLNKK